MQVWRAEELRHPVAFAMEGNFVPNNLDLGMPNFTVITGPNTGGKSTLIRQVKLRPSTTILTGLLYGPRFYPSLACYAIQVMMILQLALVWSQG